MPKRTSKVIVDAERHRRTPWTLALESKAIESKKSADIGGTGAEKGEKNMPAPSKHYQNGSPNGSKINEKSRLRRVADLFLERFWVALWRQKLIAQTLKRTISGSIFGPKTRFWKIYGCFEAAWSVQRHFF